MSDMTQPWKVASVDNTPDAIVDAEGDIVCFCDGTGDAALIVSAVNAHDALVEVARVLRSAVATGSIDTRYINEDAIAALSRLPDGTI